MKDILTRRQKLLLDLLFSQKDIHSNFYLTGGAALAQYFLHHRYSEDLDFFTPKEFDPMNIQVVLKSIEAKAGIEKFDFSQSFNRNLFYLYFGKEVVKTEFTYFPFTSIEKPQVVDKVKVDSLLDIAVNKTLTIYQKPRSRDFIDLYLIIKNKGWSFADLRKKTRLKFDTVVDPLQMAQQLLEAARVKDYPRMISTLEPRVWVEFWEKEAFKLKKEALI